MKNGLLLSGLLLALVFFFPKNATAQCGTSAVEVLVANKVKAGILNGGDLFWDRHDALFVVPYTPDEVEVNTFFAAGLWLGGFDEGDTLRVACQMYGQANGKSDFWSGPIDDDTGEPVADGCENFDVVWKVSREEIMQVIDDFADNGAIDLPLPYSIRAWPARGNPHFEAAMGFTLPDQDLAPFHDANGNGVYEPMQGERPIIDPAYPEAIPNEMTWCVFNDVQHEHWETGGKPLGVEVHLLAYGFNCEDSEVLSHTIFTRHTIINKSGGGISEFRVGVYSDYDLGCYLDDFFGCDSTQNTQYFYNEDNMDGDPGCFNVAGYGLNPPVQAVTFLNRKMGHFTFFNNQGFVDPAPDLNITAPHVDEEFFNYLNGKWRFGTPLTYGGDGYHPFSIDFANFAFPGNPNDSAGWSLNTVNLPPYFRQTIMSTESFEILAGENITLAAAYSFNRHPDSNHLQNVNYALGNIPDIQAFFDSGFEVGCMQLPTSVAELPSEVLAIEISPNPNNGNFTLRSANADQTLALTLFNLQGKTVWRSQMPAGQAQLDVDLGGHLRSGIYLLRAVGEDGRFTTRKLIVK